jgi:hypothetical protein
MKYCINSVDISKVEIKALRPEMINTSAPGKPLYPHTAPRILETPTIGRMPPMMI